MSQEKMAKKIKVNINQEEKENIFLPENEINTNSSSSLLDNNSNLKKLSSNMSYTSGHYSIINVNSYSNNNKRPFENHKTTFKNLIPDLNKISKENNNSIRFQDYFHIYVGLVTGKEDVYKNEELGNIEVLNGENKIDKYIYIENYPCDNEKINKHLSHHLYH